MVDFLYGNKSNNKIMEEYIEKSAVVAEIEKLKKSHDNWSCMGKCFHKEYENLLSFINTLEVIDPYITCIQYTDRESAIKAHAEDYSWNIESELFQQLTPEQQKLWRKEIEQAVISGGYSGLNLAKDPRYKENLEVKEVDSNDAFIERVINFLNYKLDDIVAIRNPDSIIPQHIVKPELIEDFKKYIEEYNV